MSEELRKHLTKEQRSFVDLNLQFDPIYINHRKFETVFGETGMHLVDHLTRRLPTDLPEWLKKTRLNQVYSKVAIDICTHANVPTLSALLAQKRIARGQLICSTETLGGVPDIYDKTQATSKWIPAFESDYEVDISFSTEYITCSTGWINLGNSEPIGIVAQVEAIEGLRVTLRPIVMGAPTLGLTKHVDPGFDIIWYGYDFYEHFVEDIDEFSAVTTVPTDIEWEDQMKDISEAKVKESICKLLGETPDKDWGGELADIFSTGVHINGKRFSAAFLLKGPAKFSPMKMTHLGKNGDQIFRLSALPADLLVVQHSHLIEPAVRATLRAFAVQPGNPRRYCLIDGKDTFRLLTAHGLI